MPETARPDPLVTKFVPDPELVAYAYNQMRERERHSQTFLRQRWEEAFAAVRVALAALREVYPAERAQLDDHEAGLCDEALDLITCAHAQLDGLSDTMLGWQMVDVLHGRILSREDFDLLTGEEARPHGDKA
jgi:hypothetical protein